MSGRGMARADLFTGAVLFALSVAVVYGAWTMDRLEIRQIHPLSAPGLTPGLLGIALAAASVLLLLNAARRLGSPAGNKPAGAGGPEAATADRGAASRLLTAGLLCLVYALGLVGRMPFWLATTIFVAVFILAFEWRPGAGRSAMLRSLAWALGIGLATGVGVAYAFSEIFLIRLP
jgi:putative tricarboxylic transport membrane protein